MGPTKNGLPCTIKLDNETMRLLKKWEKEQARVYLKLGLLEIVSKDFDPNQVIGWIKKCFNQFKPTHERDCIRSFQYVANYIFDQAYKNNQEVLQDEKNTDYIAEDEYFKRYGAKFMEEAKNINRGE